jgi:tripartite ATP-independent transporter DctM subunit
MLQVIGNITWNTANDFALTSIPLFLLMGEIILVSNVSTNFYNGIAKFLRKIPGGLLHSNILACAIFSAISGSSVATAAAIGSVAIPDEKKRNYKREYVYGSLAAGGTLGILIPPSIALIIYGALTTTSVAKLFTAALVPGLILASIYMVYIFFNSILLQKGF